MIYACDNCYYLFETEDIAEQCPDCGKYTVRKANEKEQKEYMQRKEETDNWEE